MDASEVIDALPSGLLDHESAPWACPVCATPTPHVFGPGRRRIYCSNSCKQKAYRHRRAHGIRILATPWLPAQRSNGHKMHAQRPAADPVGDARDWQRRQPTLCGAFAYPVRPGPGIGHHEFVPGGFRACKSCTNLMGADPAWHEQYPVMQWGPKPTDVRYRPPSERFAQYLAEHQSQQAA